MIRTLWRLSREAIRYRKLYITAILSTLALTVVNLIAPRILSAMTGIVESGVDEAGLHSIGLLTAGLVVLYVFGTTWLIWITKLPLEKALRAAVYPFVALDSAKAAVAILFGRVLKKRLALLR